jgi:hypothetical protein
MPMPLGSLEGHGVMWPSAYGTCQRRIGYRARRTLDYIGVGQEHWPIVNGDLENQKFEDLWVIK